MYVPKHFSESDPATIVAWVRAIGFGALVTAGPGGLPEANHIPFLFAESRGALGTLRGHLAKANPQTAAITGGAAALVVLQGPHGYVSPRWYSPGPAVPTWNFTAVHMTGHLRLVEGEDARASVADLVAVYEPVSAEAWRLRDQPEEYIDRMLRGITAFEIDVETVTAKSKLSQNRPADREAIVAGLRATHSAEDALLADAMAGIWPLA